MDAYGLIIEAYLTFMTLGLWIGQEASRVHPPTSGVSVQ